MINTGKIIGAVILLLLLVAGGYLAYNNSPNEAELITQRPTADNADSDEALQQLNRLQGVNLNKDFLSSQAFRSLKNFGVTIRRQSAGRDNPFLPSQVTVSAEVVESQQEALQIPGSDQPATSSEAATTSEQSTSSQQTTSSTSKATSTQQSGTSTNTQPEESGTSSADQ